MTLALDYNLLRGGPGIYMPGVKPVVPCRVSPNAKNKPTHGWLFGPGGKPQTIAGDHHLEPMPEDPVSAGSGLFGTTLKNTGSGWTIAGYDVVPYLRLRWGPAPTYDAISYTVLLHAKSILFGGYNSINETSFESNGAGLSLGGNSYSVTDLESISDFVWIGVVDIDAAERRYYVNGVPDGVDSSVPSWDDDLRYIGRHRSAYGYGGAVIEAYSLLIYEGVAASAELAADMSLYPYQFLIPEG